MEPEFLSWVPCLVASAQKVFALLIAASRATHFMLPISLHVWLNVGSGVAEVVVVGVCLGVLDDGFGDVPAVC